MVSDGCVDPSTVIIVQLVQRHMGIRAAKLCRRNFLLTTYLFMCEGENEEIREKIAAGLGAFAQHCSVEEVRQMLAGPVAAPSGQAPARMGAALIIANTAQFAPQRYRWPAAHSSSRLPGSLGMLSLLGCKPS